MNFGESNRALTHIYKHTHEHEQEKHTHIYSQQKSSIGMAISNIKFSYSIVFARFTNKTSSSSSSSSLPPLLKPTKQFVPHFLHQLRFLTFSRSLHPSHAFSLFPPCNVVLAFFLCVFSPERFSSGVSLLPFLPDCRSTECSFSLHAHTHTHSNTFAKILNKIRRNQNEINSRK